MRDPKRLDTIYHFINGIHKAEFPDWRVGQFWMNFLSWYGAKHRTDVFYLEDTKILEAIDDFIQEIKNS